GPYKDFVRSAVTGDNPGPGFLQNFTGSAFNDVATTPLLRILNVRYVITDAPPNTRQLRDLLVKKSAAVSRPGLGVGPSDLDVNGQVRHGIYFTGPLEWIFTMTTLAPDDEFRFYFTTGTQWWESNDPDRGDGSEFRVYVEEGATRELLFSKYIDPKNVPEERRWHYGVVSLKGYEGKKIRIILQTLPGPRGDARKDEVVWSDFHFKSTMDPAPQMPLVYDGEYYIYERTDCLPRAWVCLRSEEYASRDAVLRRMHDPAWNPEVAALLTTPLTDEIRSAIRDNPATSSSTISITDSVGPRVRLTADLDHPGFVIHSQTAYPGWRAYVDGKESKLLEADGFLQCVFVPAGRHTVEIIYAPQSFQVGLRVSGVSLALIILINFFPRTMLHPSRHNSDQG
ncbi:MAG: hypothetical protein V2A74_11320, partial [bacterium]